MEQQDVTGAHRDARHATPRVAHSRVAVLVAACAIAGVCLLMASVGAADTRLVTTVHGNPLPWTVIVGATSPRWVLLAVALPAILVVTLRYPPWRLEARALVLQVVMFTVLVVGHAIVQTLLTEAPVLLPPTGRLTFTLRAMRTILSAAPIIVPLYAGTLLTAWGMEQARDRRLRALREAQLESQLHAARLAALKSQLHPHFLYNTLNGIAALVADRQHQQASVALEQLAELLHAAFRDDGRDLIPLFEEVELAERYLALQQLRFGDRLSYDVSITPRAMEAMVPPLILQPLVENAVIHGLAGRCGRMDLALRAREAADHVTIVVSHDGAELPPDWAPQSSRGVGLRNTRERLASAFGAQARLVVRRRDGGGVEAHVQVPAPAGQPAVAAPPALQPA